MRPDAAINVHEGFGARLDGNGFVERQDHGCSSNSETGATLNINVIPNAFRALGEAPTKLGPVEALGLHEIAGLEQCVVDTFPSLS